MGVLTATSHHNRPRSFGNYEILSRLGQGGMAEVFKARVLSGPRAGWLVAIKRLSPVVAHDPSYLDQFAHEAELTRFLDHPNIIKVYEVGAEKGTYYMAMELIDGCDVSRIIRRLKQRKVQFPIDFAVYLVKVLLEALAYAHQAASGEGKPLGIVHCDISPSNLFVSRKGEIKLGDFGIAYTPARTHHTQKLAGKPYYLSPELIESEQVTPAIDLWAAAVMLYELLTLQRPFRGDTPKAVFDAIRERRFQPLRALRSEVRAQLGEIVERALAASVSDRFRSASDFAAALSSQYDERIGTPMAIAAIVRGLFGAGD
jgi:serine/threonine-protein kinase